MSEVKAVALCSVCGEPMPPGEEMFNFHGYSGNCPKPPLPMPVRKSVIEYFFRDAKDGAFWIDINVNGKTYDQLGPFDTFGERLAAYDDLMSMLDSLKKPKV